MAANRLVSALGCGDRFGPFVLVRPLRAGLTSPRWLAKHTLDETNHTVHIFDLSQDRHDRRRFLGAVERVARLGGRHVLPVEQYSLCTAGRGWVVTPFTGDHDGLLLLTDVLEQKSGRLGMVETARVVEQLLRASADCHEAGVCHGPIDARQVLVDRRGALHVELYGLGEALGGRAFNLETTRDEVRSIAAIGYECLTGVAADEPLIPIGRLVKKMDKAWRVWFDAALDPAAGFESSAEALRAIPGVGSETEAKPLRVSRV